MFTLDRFIADCRAVSPRTPSHKLAREVVARAVAEPAAVLKGPGEPKLGHVDTLYRGDDLTILSVVWPPRCTITPPEHRMWAVIGVYAGAEDNRYWRRVGEPDGPGNSKIEAAGACSLRVGDAEPLGRDIIHSVTNPVEKLTGAIHVYGGDFFAVRHSGWGPQTLMGRVYDTDKNPRLFQEANARLAAA